MKNTKIILILAIIFISVGLFAQEDTYRYEVRVTYDTSQVEPPAPARPFSIWVPAAALGGPASGQTLTNGSFWRNDDVSRLLGTYTPVVPDHPNAPECYYYWEPEFYDVTEDMFVELEGGFNKAHYNMRALIPFVLMESCNGGGSPTTPVELSSFTATVTAQNYVKLNWVTQTETEMLGYRVYRNTIESQENAILITPVMIPATNTSSIQTYTFEDREVENGTYWYWLESVDYNTSNFHGPTTVIVQGEIIPELPNISELKNAYPNPFKVSASTNIEVDIKAGETGTVTIYNILGQAVKTYTVNAGHHNLNWNGRDSRGNSVGSGLYFYKLSTPSINQTKKMVIVK